MNPQKKKRLKELQARIKTLQTAIPSGEIKSLTDQIVSEHVQKLQDGVKNDSIIKYLDGLNEKIGQFRKDFNLGPVVEQVNNLIDDIAKLRKENEDNLNAAHEQSESRLFELQEQLAAGLSQTSVDSQEFTSKNIKSVQDALEGLNQEILFSNTTSEGKTTSLKEAITSIEDKLEKLGNKLKNSNQKHTEGIAESRSTSETSLKTSIAELRKELLGRLGNIGHGGNMNRNISVNGNTSMLSRYTDLNIKPGANVTLTYTNNNTTKAVDLTIAASGGGGGNSRSVNSESTSFTADGTAGTDFVYICSTGLQVTMPTASGNTNLYTVKNTAASSVLVTPNGADTIDAAANLILRTQYTSVDLISDGSSNWSIT